MIFLIKKRKVVLDLFTCQPRAFEFAKPKVATQFFPEWWKELKAHIPDNEVELKPTMKRCMGFVDHYKHGIILPMWTDFRVEIGEIGTEYHYGLTSDGYTPIIQHSVKQRGTFAPADKYCSLKFESPWAARCKEDVYFKWEQPTWNMNNLTAYVVLPATVEFVYANAINVHVMFPRSTTRDIRQISFGTPLVHLTPLTEREIDLRYHMVTPTEYSNFEKGYRVTFLNSYRTFRRAMEEA
jgi:hypothetical protein